MRPIRFRVWQKSGQKMHHCLKAKFGKATNITLDGKFKDVDQVTTLTVPNDDLEIMQFTGLLDTKGNEVCEGDIIEVRHLEPKANYAESLSPGPLIYRVQVVWYDYGFSLERHRDDGSLVSRSSGLEFHSTYYKMTEIEIIGNIYENPELIA